MITVNVTEEWLKTADHKAKELGLDRSEFIRRATDAYASEPRVRVVKTPW